VTSAHDSAKELLHVMRQVVQDCLQVPRVTVDMRIAIRSRCRGV
jgi:hypothetical protein